MTCEGKYPEYIIGTIPGLNDKAHAAVSSDGKATVLTESKDIGALGLSPSTHQQTLQSRVPGW